MSKQDVALVIAALAGDCNTCGYKTGCECDICTDYTPRHVLHRCSVCHRAGSAKHSVVKSEYLGIFGRPTPNLRWGAIA